MYIYIYIYTHIHTYIYMYIYIYINDKNCLNKKSELIGKCRHLNKVLLKSIKKT